MFGVIEEILERKGREARTALNDMEHFQLSHIK